MSSSVVAEVDGVAEAKGAIVYIEYRVNQRVRPEQFVGGDAAGADAPDVLHLDPPLRWAAPERSKR